MDAELELALKFVAPTRSARIDMALDMIFRIIKLAKAGDRDRFDKLFKDGPTGEFYLQLKRIIFERQLWDLWEDVDALLGNTWTAEGRDEPT